MTIAEHLKATFDPFYPAPIEAWQAFANAGERMFVHKEEILKANHTIERYFYFVLQGSGGVLLWNKHNSICIDICLEHEILCDFASFLTQEATPIEIIAFEDSELLRISKSHYLELTKTSIGAAISRACSEALYIHKQQQQIDILTKTAKERYQALQTQHPQILQKIPQKYIASYLGITPQSLSRIRAELAHS
jgi:CRP-like cAMP-binding protein